MLFAITPENFLWKVLFKTNEKYSFQNPAPARDQQMAESHYTKRCHSSTKRFWLNYNHTFSNTDLQITFTAYSKESYQVAGFACSYSCVPIGCLRYSQQFKETLIFLGGNQLFHANNILFFTILLFAETVRNRRSKMIQYIWRFSRARSFHQMAGHLPLFFREQSLCH